MASRYKMDDEIVEEDAVVEKPLLNIDEALALITSWQNVPVGERVRLTKFIESHSVARDSNGAHVVTPKEITPDSILAAITANPGQSPVFYAKAPPIRVSENAPIRVSEKARARKTAPPVMEQSEEMFDFPAWARPDKRTERTPAKTKERLENCPRWLMWLNASDQERLLKTIVELLPREPTMVLLMRVPVTKAILEPLLREACFPFIYTADEDKTPAVCAMAVTYHPNLLMYVPPVAKSAAVFKSAGLIYPATARHYTSNTLEQSKIPPVSSAGPSNDDAARVAKLYTTEKDWLAAVSKDWRELQYCPPAYRSRQVVITAIEGNPSAIATLTTDEQVRYADLITDVLQREPFLISAVRRPTIEMTRLVMGENSNLFPLIRPAYHSEETRKMAEAADPDLLQYTIQ